MTTDSIIKAIVNAVKSREELSSVVCLYSNSREPAENPVCSFTLCIGIGKSEYSSKSSSLDSGFTTEAKLCLLAPKGAGGKRLAEMSHWVAEAIRDALSVSRIEISEPRYIDASGTLFTDIVIKIENVSAKDEDCKIYVDDSLLGNIVSFETESTLRAEKKPELLNGYSVSDTAKREYKIRLRTKDLIKTCTSFRLEFEYKSFKELYSGCCISKQSRVQDHSGAVSFNYDITAEGMTFIQREVQDEY